MSEPSTPEPTALEIPDPVHPLPLDAWHRARGARMVPFAGYQMPIQYDGIIAEHLWTRENAGLFDVSHMGQLLLSGEGLDAALEAILPADLASLKPGRLRYSLLLNDEGGILDDLMLTRWDDGIAMVVNGATKWDDIGHLHEALPSAVTINHLDEQGLLALQGPKAAAVLARLASGDAPVDSLTFMTAGRFAIGGVPVTISRSGYTGEDGFEISVPADAIDAVATAIADQGEVRPIGLGARDSLRLEAGLPLYGHDLDERTDPVSADLAFAISKRRRGEGGFPGADKILGYLADRAPAKRVGLVVEGRQPVREGAQIYAGEDLVGTVTSGGFSPSLQVPIAMGYVAAAFADLDTPLSIEVRGKRLLARVAAMPFLPHRYHRKGV